MFKLIFFKQFKDFQCLPVPVVFFFWKSSCHSSAFIMGINCSLFSASLSKEISQKWNPGEWYSSEAAGTSAAADDGREWKRPWTLQRLRERGGQQLQPGWSESSQWHWSQKEEKKQKRGKKGSETDSAQDQPVKMNSLPAERIRKYRRPLNFFGGSGTCKNHGGGYDEATSSGTRSPSPSWEKLWTRTVPWSLTKTTSARIYNCPGLHLGPWTHGTVVCWGELCTLYQMRTTWKMMTTCSIWLAPQNFFSGLSGPPGWLPQWHCRVRVSLESKN